MKSEKYNIVYLLTDFSEHARNACRYAINAFGYDTKYVLINTYMVRSSAATLIDIEQIAYQEALESLVDEEVTLKKEFKDENFDLEIICKYGTPADVINKLHSSDIPADMVVVGSKGMDKTDEILLGSVTTAIMRKVRIPVLSVPLQAQYEGIKEVVLASNLDNVNKNEVVHQMAKLKQNFSAHLSAATVVESKEEANAVSESMQAELERIPPLDDISVLYGDSVVEEMAKYCVNTDADLLVVIAKHTGFFQRFFHKSVSKELINHEVLPILVLEDR